MICKCPKKRKKLTYELLYYFIIYKLCKKLLNYVEKELDLIYNFVYRNKTVLCTETDNLFYYMKYVKSYSYRLVYLETSIRDNA